MNGQEDAGPARGVRLGFRPALTGLRALGVLLVMAFHLDPSGLVPGGHIGVDLFFVLSGFLITAILVEEWRVTGVIGLLRFYTRRALRLMPALVFLLVVFVVYAAALQTGAERTKSFRSAGIVLLYVSNVFQGYTGVPFSAQLQHAWSLAMEEQFYLIWPPVLLLLLRMRVSFRAMLAGTAAGALFFQIARVAVIEGGFVHTPENLFYAPPFRADALLVGCLMGLAFAYSRGAAWIRRPRPVAIAGGLGLASMIAYGFVGSSTVRYLEGGILIAVAAAALVWWFVVDPSSAVARVFSSGPMVGIGKISYALYLWHVPVLYACRGIGLDGLALLAAFLLGSFGLATTSYFVVERPALRLKSRFARVEREVAGEV